MRLPRVRFTVRRMMAKVVLASLTFVMLPYVRSWQDWVWAIVLIPVSYAALNASLRSDRRAQEPESLL